MDSEHLLAGKASKYVTVLATGTGGHFAGHSASSEMQAAARAVAGVDLSKHVAKQVACQTVPPVPMKCKVKAGLGTERALQPLLIAKLEEDVANKRSYFQFCLQDFLVFFSLGLQSVLGIAMDLLFPVLRQD
eukprot:1856110-Amphidinium_carterae.1